LSQIGLAGSKNFFSLKESLRTSALERVGMNPKPARAKLLCFSQVRRSVSMARSLREVTSFSISAEILFSQFDHFAVFYFFSVNGETYDGPYSLPALFACCPGIYMQAIQFLVVHDL